MKDEPPLVSIVVPCYNHEKYVKGTIQSILDQTYENIELIVIDDGSRDNSVEVIRCLADKHSFTFIHRENRGLSSTLNEGLRLSKGKYFSVCASDDVLFLNKIEKQIKFMELNSQYAMCYGKIIRIDDLGNQKELSIKNAKSGWIFEELITFKFVLPAVSTMMKRDVLVELNGYDEDLWIEDWDMWLRIAVKYQIGYMNNYLAYYRTHGENISNETLNMCDAQMKIIKKYAKHEKYEQYLEIWQLIWFNCLARNNKKEARRYLKIAQRNFFKYIAIKALIKFYFINDKIKCTE